MGNRGNYIAVTELKIGDTFKKYETHWKVLSIEYESKGTIEFHLEKNDYYPRPLQVSNIQEKTFRKTTKVLKVETD